MNKKTFDQTLNQLKKTLVANYKSVKIIELDTSKFRYANDLSYNVDTKNWKIQIDYNQSNEDGSIKRVEDRSMALYFDNTRESKLADRTYKAIYVYSNENSTELYDYSIMVDVSVNSRTVASYRKLVDADDLSREIINSALGNS
jgi:hypothetical protein